MYNRAGNEFLCHSNKLRDPKSMSEEDLENSVYEAIVGRYSGDIKVHDQRNLY